MFVEIVKERFKTIKSIFCLGLDPVIENFPFQKENIENTIVYYFSELMDTFQNKILAIKPNSAFYEQYGIEGIQALKKIIEKGKSLKIPVILDAKRGDIGATSKAYAKFAFDFLKADAITLAPYMGEDSLNPFFEYKDKGFFILARTSNPGSSNFQMLEINVRNGDEKNVNKKYLYEIVLENILNWNNKYSSGIGAVAGATHINEFENIVKYFSLNNQIPLLIPGVGKQGGDFNQVVEIVKKYNYDLSKIFINSSSKILYAHKEYTNLNYIDAAALEINKMML